MYDQRYQRYLTFLCPLRWENNKHVGEDSPGNFPNLTLKNQRRTNFTQLDELLLPFPVELELCPRARTDDSAPSV